MKKEKRIPWRFPLNCIKNALSLAARLRPLSLFSFARFFPLTKADLMPTDIANFWCAALFICPRGGKRNVRRATCENAIRVILINVQLYLLQLSRTEWGGKAECLNSFVAPILRLFIFSFGVAAIILN